MRFVCLACDYDGTLAKDGAVPAGTVEALKRVRESGRKLALVTGRQMGDLWKVFPQLTTFDQIVAENGAVLFDARSSNERLLAGRPPDGLVNELRRRGVEISEGRAVVATWRPYLEMVRGTIRDLKLDSRVILNKNSVMILPPGVDKASGLRAALAEFGAGPEKTIGVGDAENDEDFLAICGMSVAVANALPELKSKVMYVTKADHGAGVEELIGELLANDLNEILPVTRPR